MTIALAEDFVLSSNICLSRPFPVSDNSSSINRS
jgi:hypothetical protein